MNEPIDSYLDSIDDDNTVYYSDEMLLEEACRNPRHKLTWQERETLNTMDRAVQAEYEAFVERVEAASVDAAPFYERGQLYFFTDTEGGLHLCQVDIVTRDKVFAYGENASSFNGLFYQRIDTIPTLCPAPVGSKFSRELSADDEAWIEYMRSDQLTPEKDVEFRRIDRSQWNVVGIIGE